MYQNIFVDRKEWIVHLWDDVEGYTCFPYERYAYRRSADGPYRSLYGDKLDKVYTFNDTDPDLFESDVNPEMRVLVDKYEDSDEPSINHRVVILDIEVDSTGGFPNIDTGDKTITAIAMYNQLSDHYISLVLDPESKVKNKIEGNVEIKSFRTEKSLLLKFLNIWDEIGPTIVSGWNIAYFDIPYLFNRIRNVLGKGAGYRLSPVKIAYQNSFTKKIMIAGISVLDYLELYKKFVGVMKPSWSLSNVAKDEELKNQKLTYKGSLTDLYKNDIHRYIEYNLTDVKVVVELDKKYDFIYLARSVCHKGHVPYENFQMSSRFIDGAILMYLKRNKLVAPNKPPEGRAEYEDMERGRETGYTGAFVKMPFPGLYDWIASADITSLYPSTIMTLNISPETKIAKIDGWDRGAFDRNEIYNIQLGDENLTCDEFRKKIKNYKYSIASNGVVYRQDIRGVIPNILDLWFSERVEYRKKAGEFAKAGDKEQEAFYDRRQKRQKIFLNCFSPDTDVITNDGIRRISDLKIGDLVYSLNRNTGQSVLKPVTRVYEYEYNGEMVHFNSKYIDFLVTPNHKFWVSKAGKTQYKKFGWEYAEEIGEDKVRRKFPYINALPPRVSNANNNTDTIDLAKYADALGMKYIFRNNDSEIRISRNNDQKQKRHTQFVPRFYKMEDWLEFIGWYISEGSLHATSRKEYKNGNVCGNTYSVSISQRNYAEKVKLLLERMKLPYSHHKLNFMISNDVIYEIIKSECGQYGDQKRIPLWVFELSPDKLRCLFKILMLGGGHTNGLCYTTKSNYLKNDIIRLILHIGDRHAFCRNIDSDCYRIGIPLTKGRSPVLKSNHKKIVPYNGKVYCVEVDGTHTLLAGRNGKFQWCGQSVYGTLGLPVFRFYDKDNAEAVTMSGQEIILSASRLVNDEFLNRYRNKSVTPPTDDFVVYIDTDSIYFSSLQLAKLEGKTDDMAKYTIDLVQHISNKINRLYEYMIPRIFNVAPESNRIKIVPDVVAKKALWIVKKRYAMLKVFDMEKMKPVIGKNGEEGKLEVKGIDVVRSSYPAAFRKFSANILESILRGIPREELDEKIMKFEENIEKCTVDELCKTSSVRFKSKDGGKNYNPIDRKRFQFVLGSPPQVKGALTYNDLLRVWKLHRQYESIGHSEKIKWCYLLPNDFNLSEISFKGDDTDPDEILEFISHHIDRKKMYDRELKSKLSEIYAVIGWSYPNRGSQLATNTFDFDEEW